MCGKATGLLLILMTIAVMGNLPPMDDDIGEEIFHQNKIYLIYVCDFIQDSVVATLNEFCIEGKLCTIMSPDVELYEKLEDFIGMPVKQYLLILDVANRSKYTLSIPDKGLTLQKINQFYTKFHRGQWERFLSSEPIPTSEPDPYLQKLVGLNLKEWLSGQAKAKVVYLYTADELCDNCFKIYKLVAEIAKKYLGSKDIVFGHFDLFKNEHTLLKEENVPFVLIYENGSFEPKRLEPSQIHTLEDEITRILAGKKEDDL